MPNIAALAAQSAAQGNQMLQDDRNQAATYTGQYNQYKQQADQANQQVGNYTNYMAGAGSAGNQYHNELGSQLGQLGYDQNQMTAARGNLNQATGALSAYSDFANQGASKFGLNAGGFAAANSGALSNLNNNIASNQGVVNSLSDLYKTAQTGANQFAGQQVESEKNTLAGYQQQFANAASQRDAAASQMQFFNQLASSQGSLNAQEQQYYGAAQASYAAASASMANAAYLASQTTGQNIQNTANQNQLNQTLARQQQAAQDRSNNEYQTMMTGTPQSHSGFSNFTQTLGHDASNVGNFIGRNSTQILHSIPVVGNYL